MAAVCGFLATTSQSKALGMTRSSKRENRYTCALLLKLECFFQINDNKTSYVDIYTKLLLCYWSKHVFKLTNFFWWSGLCAMG